MSRKILASVVVAASLAGAISAMAAVEKSEMKIPPPLKKFSQEDQLPSGTPFFNFMRPRLKDEMAKTSVPNTPFGGEGGLVQDGNALLLHLIPGQIENMHANFNAQPTSGRSFGWTKDSDGKVGDWSDRTYLTNLQDVVYGDKSKDADLAQFYTALVQLVGAGDTTELAKIKDVNTQRVVANFLAIYGAEEYRAAIPNGMHNWDDAIFDVTLLAAFHAGQNGATVLYYAEPKPRFVSKVCPQEPGSEAPKSTCTPSKDADLTDYWQYTIDPSKKNSGINETRVDFQAMGAAITSWEMAHNKQTVTDLVEAVDGTNANAFEDVTQFFALGKTKTSGAIAEASDIAAKLSKFLIQVKDDAPQITSDLLKGADPATEGAEPNAGDGTPTRTPTRKPAPGAKPRPKAPPAAPAPKPAKKSRSNELAADASPASAGVQHAGGWISHPMHGAQDGDGGR